MSGRVYTCLWGWQVVPCTIAVVAGPLITSAYRVTSSPDVQVGNLSLAQMLRGLLCLAMFLSLFLSRRLCLLDHPLIRPLIFLSIYAVVTLLLVPYPYENIVLAVKLVFICLVFASAFHLAESQLCSEYWLTLSAWAILIFMVVSQAIGLATGHATATYQSDYATAGLIDQPAVTAALIVSTLPIHLRFFPDRGHSVLGVLLLLVSVFFTMRRTEIAAVLGAILFVLLCYVELLRHRAAWGKVALAVLALVVLAITSLRTQAGADLLARINELDPRQGSGSGRYIFWLISLQAIVDRTIGAQVCGQGVESIRDIIDEHLGQAVGAHNDWLSLTHAFGMFGLAGLVWWYWRLAGFTSYLRKRNDPTFQGVLSALVIFFVISLGQGGFYDPSLVMMYAALGFWAGQSSYWEPFCYAGRPFYRTV